MHKFIALAAGASMLAGCTGTSTIPASITTFIANAQATVAATCAVEPTAASIASLLSANPAIATAEAVASLICGAVAAATPKAAHRGSRLKASAVPSPVVVDGVTIVFEPVTK